MKLNIYSKQHEWKKAKGLCVVIDVLRAFTTAAFAFDSGVKSIRFVGTVEEAFQLHRENPEYLLMGETDGLPIKGFHYGNSPREIADADLKHKQMIQRTTAGTQGIIHCSKADCILASSFVIADATLEVIHAKNPDEISFIITGQKNGDEDLALADYLIARLQGEVSDVAPFLDRVKDSPSGLIFQNPDFPQFNEADLQLAMEINRFPFTIEVQKSEQGWIGFPLKMGKSPS